MDKVVDIDHTTVRNIQGASFASEAFERDDKVIHKGLVRLIWKEEKKMRAKKTLFNLANTILIVNIHVLIGIICL
jgi:hypothetical protein